MAEKKRYTIRVGKQTWVFDNRSEVQPLVSWFAGAKYKSFKSEPEAQKALWEGRENYYQPEKKRYEKELPFVKQSIAVDAACSSSTGIMEYQGIDLVSQKTVFHCKHETGTNNIWEFLAIVHALAYLKQEKKADFAVYSDSKTAISRILNKRCKTNLAPTEENKPLFELIKRAETRLKNNTYQNQILKRKTEDRWEIPADFGRK